MIKIVNESTKHLIALLRQRGASDEEVAKAVKEATAVSKEAAKAIAEQTRRARPK